MTQRQINSLNMFQAVLQYLNDNTTTWSGNTFIAAGVNTFSASVNTIQKNASAQQSSSKQGYTSKKNEDLENLIDLTYKLALRVKNYAVSIHDAVLKQAVDFSRHELETGKETDIVNRCKNIINNANSVTGTAPSEFKITAELIEQATTAADAIEPDKAQRDVASGTHSGATAQISSLFATARQQLHVLDDLIEADADDNVSEFVSNYFIMRRTVDRKGGGGKGDDTENTGNVNTTKA